jgi:hypothetical protein
MGTVGSRAVRGFFVRGDVLAKRHTSGKLVRLGQAKIDSSYPTRCQSNRDSGRDSVYPTQLHIKEGVQRSVEIAYCNCKIPFWQETAYTLSAVNW